MKIKSVLPSIISEDRLTNIAILSIDHEYAKKIKFFIEKFTEVKLKTETVILFITVSKQYKDISFFKKEY